MAFQSEFADNAKLNACAINDPDHVGEQFAPNGPWVALIKKALNTWAAKQRPPVTQIPVNELFGRETGDLVALYKTKQTPPILNFAGQIDRIVGKKTVVALDKELPPRGGGVTPPPGPTPQQVIAAAFQQSRDSLRVVLNRMTQFEAEIDRADQLNGNDKIIAIQNLGRTRGRDIAIVADKLKVSLNPLTPAFRDALKQARALVQQNLNQTSGIIDGGTTGRCAATNFNPPGVPFAATTKSDADPRVSVCVPFFPQNADMRRDVLTHEFFHLVGLADLTSITTTAQALNDANTVAQVVAYMHDRTRQRDSSGLSQPPVTYPSP